MGKQTRRKIGLRSALFPNVWSNDVDDADVVRAQVTRLKDALPAGRQASPSSSANSPPNDEKAPSIATEAFLSLASSPSNHPFRMRRPNPPGIWRSARTPRAPAGCTAARSAIRSSNRVGHPLSPPLSPSVGFVDEQPPHEPSLPRIAFRTSDRGGASGGHASSCRLIISIGHKVNMLSPGC